MFWLMLAGCSYTLAVSSDTPGARADAGEGPVVLPAEFDVPWAPFSRSKLTVSATGYRPLEVGLGWHMIRTGDHGVLRMGRRAELDVMLVRDHDGIGSWTPDSLGLETQ